MKFSGFIVAIVVLAALGGALYWSNHHMPSETTRASAETPPKILTLNEADINKIDIKKKGGEEVTLTKDNGGNWKVIAPKPLGADQSAVSSMLSSLSSLNSDRLVEEKASNFNQYGLSEPTLQIGVTEKNSKTHQLLVGDDTPTNNGAYVRVEGDPRVFTLAAYNKTTLDKSLNDLRDKRLLTLESDKISRIELTANKQIIEFGRNKDQWQILRPKPLRADSAQVDELLRKLTDAKMESGSETDSKKLLRRLLPALHSRLQSSQPILVLRNSKFAKTKTTITRNRAWLMACTRCLMTLVRASTRTSMTSATKSCSISASTIPTR